MLTNSDFRKEAIEALEKIGSVDEQLPSRLESFLLDERSDVRRGVLKVLVDRTKQWGVSSDPGLLATCLESSLINREQTGVVRLTCYLMGFSESPQLRLLMQWVNDRPGEFPSSSALDLTQARSVLTTFRDLWKWVDRRDAHTKEPLTPGVRATLAAQIRQLVTTHAAQLELSDIPLIEDLNLKLWRAGLTADSAVLQNDIDKVRLYARARAVLGVVLLHALAWVLLLWAYPRSALIQSLFFWNPWGRRFLGLGYVSLLILTIPSLRRRMFLPFRYSLLQKGSMAQYDPASYFPDSEVIVTRAGHTLTRQPARVGLPSATGQFVLQGESGVGKTITLLRLAATTSRICVLLRATECTHGVLAAIQARVQGQVRDEHYLRSLIYAGAIDVLIDGLNETIPETRTRIVSFVEESFRGNFVLTTQPMEWTPPRTATVLELQTLRPDQISDFLLRQWPAASATSELTEVEYRSAVTTYVGAIASAGDNDPRLRVLSNPMEAGLVAELLAAGEHPDLLRLVAQRFAIMEMDFRSRHARAFPYSRFSEHVYDWRRSGEPYLAPVGFDAEIAALVDHKIMIERTVLVRGMHDAANERRWWFRHDRFMEYCLLPAFLGEHAARRKLHAADDMFFGVYELLALQLDEADDQELWQFLVEHAADSRRSDLVNRYTIARRGRHALA
jgi:hypothetical protein